jgi:nitric oxide reductase activation protein
VTEYPDLVCYPLRTASFLPDFFYPGVISAPPKEGLIADLKDQANTRRDAGNTSQSEHDQPLLLTDHNDAVDSDEADQNEKSVDGINACFVYDEWSQPDNDYYRNYCHLYEHVPESSYRMTVSVDLLDAANQIRKVFELLKPDVVKNEKYLSDGDVINPDLLVQYLVQRKQEPCPKIDFYEKPSIQQRDIAVLVLLDISGSTGETLEESKVLDLEKQAAIMLGQGLHTLGDQFAVCGFCGNGREHCDYYHFKHFTDQWNPDSIGRIMAARPLGSTRIGVALRHAGYRLSRIEAKQRMIILVTDGRPMDNGYDPKTRYAQYDVRMACEENKRQAIYTFCISTEENSRADMEIMFPDQRFMILADMRQLPRVLPRLYIKMTT